MSELREQWLTRAMPDIEKLFKDAGYEVPGKIRVSCGWPHKGGCGQRKRTLGQCWDKVCSTDAHWHIFISPTIEDSSRALDILIHEVVHTVVGLKAGHKKVFAACAKAVGLKGPWTKTTATPELDEKLKKLIARIGKYPHGALKPAAVDKTQEKGRMLKLECVCGLKVRSTQKWIDTYGSSWPCPCGDRLKTETADDDEGDDE